MDQLEKEPQLKWAAFGGGNLTKVIAMFGRLEARPRIVSIAMLVCDLLSSPKSLEWQRSRSLVGVGGRDLGLQKARSTVLEGVELSQTQTAQLAEKMQRLPLLTEGWDLMTSGLDRSDSSSSYIPRKPFCVGSHPTP
jgi:hypothetical protein